MYYISLLTITVGRWWGRVGVAAAEWCSMQGKAVLNARLSVAKPVIE